MVKVTANSSRDFRNFLTMANERYNPRDAEPRWQAKWTENKVFETSNDDPLSLIHI